jgi:hypothetical protein
MSSACELMGGECERNVLAIGQDSELTTALVCEPGRELCEQLHIAITALPTAA